MKACTLAQAAAGLPQWLFDESYDAVGDLAETIALLLPPATESHDLGLAVWIEQRLLPLRKTAPDALADTLRAQWEQLAPDERLVYFKLMAGGFRVGVSSLQVTQALAAVGGIAVRFPRMLRWREDKPAGEADTLQTLAALLPS